MSIIYNEQEFNQLLECVKNTKDEIPIILASLCGMRMGEIIGLTWENIDFETRKIIISQNAVSVKGGAIIKEPKTFSSKRIVIAPDYVLNVLLKYKKKSGYVFPKENGRLGNGNNYGRRFARILKQNNYLIPGFMI